MLERTLLLSFSSVVHKLIFLNMLLPLLFMLSVLLRLLLIVSFFFVLLHIQNVCVEIYVYSVIPFFVSRFRTPLSSAIKRYMDYAVSG